MKGATWWEVWRVTYQRRIGGKLTWGEPESECVVADKDGQVAVAKVRAALEGDFRLLALEHVCRVAMFLTQD